MITKAIRIFKEKLRNKYYDMKLKNKLIFTFSVLVILPILFLGITTYTLSQKYLEESERNSIETSMNQLNNSIDYLYEIYANKSLMIYSNREIQQLITKEYPEIDHKVEAQENIDKIINQITNDIRISFLKNSYYFGGNITVEMYLKNDSIYANDEYIFRMEDAIHQQWYKELLQSENFFSWQSGVKDINGAQSICLNQRLINFKNLEDIGVLRIFIPVERVRNVLIQNVYNNAVSFTYVDNNFTPIVKYGWPLDSEKNLNRLESVHKDNRINIIKFGRHKFLVGTIYSQITGWKLVYLVPMSVVTDKTRYIGLITVVTVIASILICILIATLVSSLITGRIGILVNKTNHIKQGDFSVKGRIPGNDEIGVLDGNFNDMVAKINDLIENDYKCKIIVNKTRFELLQEQTNPHLLYNTLTMVGLVAKNANQIQILDVTNNLTSFYKGILNRGRITTSLRAEVGMVKRYIELMKFVYSLRIHAVMDIEEDILNYYSIKLLLQPIVENAIVHGIKPKGGGTLIINGYEKDKSIVFEVSDDGVGMEEQVLKQLMSVLQNDEKEKGYGVSNVIKRVNLFFGEGYGVDMVSTPGAGTTVAVRVPKLSESSMKDLLESKYLV